jgi:predicted nucleic acid-binding protein
MAKKILVDSGFWFALFNENDKYRSEALKIEDDIQVHSLLIPWPTLYETVNTKAVKKPHNVARLKRFIEKPSTKLVDDAPYRENSLQFVLENNSRHFSLVDHVVRSMLLDKSLPIDGFISFNPGDFHDVCGSRIEMLYPLSLKNQFR